MKTKPKIYIFHPKISWKTFKKIWDLFPHGTIVPECFIKGNFIHGMIKRKEIIVGIDESIKDDPVFFATRLPKGEIYIIK